MPLKQLLRIESQTATHAGYVKDILKMSDLFKLLVSVLTIDAGWSANCWLWACISLLALSSRNAFTLVFLSLYIYIYICK